MWDELDLDLQDQGVKDHLKEIIGPRACHTVQSSFLCDRLDFRLLKQFFWKFAETGPVKW